MNCNVINAHERDSLLSFDEAGHNYFVNGKQLKSVTTLVQESFPQFDARYWAERKAPALNTTPERLMAQWEENAATARHRGTMMHARIEQYYHGDPAPVMDDEVFPQFKEFTRRHALTPYRIEWRIFDEGYGIAGSLDFLDKTDGKYTIWDWKRSTKVVDPATGLPAEPGRWTGRCLTRNLEHVYDTAFYHYALQLSIYRLILEDNYGIDISGQFLGVFHPDNPCHYVVEVPFLQSEARTLMRSNRR